MPITSKRYWDRLAPAIPFVLLAIALAIRLYGLSDKPLWLDEIITQRRANLAIPEMITNSLSHRHFPTYFLLVRAFDGPLIDEWMLRLPSALFGAVSVLLVALIGTEVRSRWAGIVAAGLMMLSPLEVQYSQEARSYALVSCLVLLALWGLVRIAQQTVPGPSSPARTGSQFGPWLAFTIGTIGALYVLVLAGLWLIAANLAAVVIFLQAGSRRREFLRKWALVQAIIAMAWIPALVVMAYAVGADPLRGFRWIPPTTLQHAWTVLSTVYLLRPSNVVTFDLLPTSLPVLGVAIVLLAAFGAWQLRSRPAMLAIIGITGLVVPVTVFAVSIFHPVLVPRYLLLSTGPFFVLVGIGATALPRPFSLPATAALLAFAIAGLGVYYRSETKPRWDLAAAYLAANVRDADSITGNDHMARYVLAAYGDRYRLDRKKIQSINPQSPELALRHAQEGAIWVVYGRTGQGAIGPEAAYLQKWLDAGLRPTCRSPFGLHVVVFRLEPVASGPRETRPIPLC